MKIKLSELKKIIKEEVTKAMDEADASYIAPAELNPAEITALRTLGAKGMLDELEDDMETAKKKAKKGGKDPSAARFIFQDMVLEKVRTVLGSTAPHIVGRLADLFLDKGLKAADLEGVIKASEDVEEIETRDPYADRGGLERWRVRKSTGERTKL